MNSSKTIEELRKIIDINTDIALSVSTTSDINLTEIGGVSYGLGQTTKANSMSVTIASDDVIQSIEQINDGAATKRVLNSNDRTSGSINSGALTLAVPLNGTYKVKKFTSVNNLYNVNQYNNIIDFNETATPKSATLTVGFYTEDELKDHITSQMSASSAGVVTVTYDSKTNKFSFSNTVNFAFQFLSASNSSYKLLGMNKSNVTPEAMSDVSDVGVDLAPYRSIFINFTEATTQNINTSGNVNHCVEISSRSPFGDFMSEDLESSDQYISFTNDSTINYSVKDINGNLVDGLNNWTISLDKIL